MSYLSAFFTEDKECVPVSIVSVCPQHWCYLIACLCQCPLRVKIKLAHVKPKLCGCLNCQSVMNCPLPVMLFPSRLIRSNVTICVSFSGNSENLLLAKLMLVKCLISSNESGSLLRTFPCKSSSENIYFFFLLNPSIKGATAHWHLTINWAPLSWVKLEKNLLLMAFISLSASVMTRMFSDTLLRTLKTPSGNEMSLQLDRSAGRAKKSSA